MYPPPRRPAAPVFPRNQALLTASVPSLPGMSRRCPQPCHAPAHQLEFSRCSRLSLSLPLTPLPPSSPSTTPDLLSRHLSPPPAAFPLPPSLSLPSRCLPSPSLSLSSLPLPSLSRHLSPSLFFVDDASAIPIDDSTPPSLPAQPTTSPAPKPTSHRLLQHRRR